MNKKQKLSLWVGMAVFTLVGVLLDPMDRRLPLHNSLKELDFL
jgi:hypothetical protein